MNIKIFKTTKDEQYIVISDKGSIKEKIFNLVNTSWVITTTSESAEAISALRSDSSIYKAIEDFMATELHKETRTVVDFINWFPVFVDKDTFKLNIDINWEIMEVTDNTLLTKLKDQFSEVKKIQVETTSSGSALYTIWDRVLLYWPTGTGKTYNFLDSVNSLIAAGKLDLYSIVTISEWFDDQDFFAFLAPDKDGKMKFSEKAVVQLLREAASGKKVAICFDELNRWSKSFLNLVLKMLDAVNGTTYQIYNHFNDELIEIPIENILFFATMNLWGKYVWTNSLDEALFDRFNLVQYQGYNERVEDSIYKNFWEFSDKAKTIVTHTRKMNISGELRAPLSTRGIKAWAEKFINSAKTANDFVWSFNLVALYRLCSVDDFWNPNEEETMLVLSKFKELWLIK